ncbi:LOW QUALITY PROTEIN: uncharacterized protein LOC104435562 [Eucalyptus grandis]|uniref:LOW QUALITY PROTEIN: uncharacterized protein LOC104435562 n=1 Tax=Eucalyptus grandis TaxID=71139 RepID=UPI00192E7C71|nr:LOW QUALITY PROTEIN: uncharacterized protein LOC104435562 [Eucalyptus grandis]
MVCSEGGFVGERGRVRASMAMGPERSKPLHNFTLPRLRWGSQRYMRCMKVAAADSSSAAAAAADRRSPARSHSSFQRREPGFERRRWFARDSDPGRRAGGIVGAAATAAGEDDDDDDEDGGGDCGIEAVRQKLMFDLRAETDKMKDELLREEVESVAAAAAAAAAEEAVAESGAAAAAAAAEESKPWNLRRGGRRARLRSSSAAAAAAAGRVNSSPLRTEEAAAAGGNDTKSSPRVLRGNSGGATQKTEERAKFAVALKRKEIEEDFMEMVGHRPPRRFKKRPKNVQKQLDLLFPGLWLTEISADTYKVDENPENGKR